MRDARWRPVYAAVVVFTVLVIVALWWFSRAFSARDRGSSSEQL